jgi:hypothetical protein
MNFTSLLLFPMSFSGIVSHGLEEEKVLLADWTISVPVSKQ